MILSEMSSKSVLWVAAVLLAAAAIVPAEVAQSQGVAERTGQALDKAGRGLRRGVQSAFARTRASVHQQEVIDRVYSRIHWDRTLVGSTVEIEVRDVGTVILRGVVPDDEAKDRAAVLAATRWAWPRWWTS